MDIQEKLRILAAAARYDASCASSGSNRENTSRGLGNAAKSAMGICHSWAADGRCISLLKVLFSNFCINNCAYCVNRRSNDIPRAAFTVEEIVDLTIAFYRRNYIEGLFLSSGVFKNPDYTMETLLAVLRKLRKEHNFNGYIHLKVIPGASRALIREAGYYADRLSVNIELPSERGLALLAPEKRREDILVPMSYIDMGILANREDKRKFKKTLTFVPAGQSTQLIVGATPDTDLQIISLSENLYKKFRLKRVYYSAYIPVSNNPLLPSYEMPPLKRENRLYQADWLMRFYGFTAREIVDPYTQSLEAELDPKTSWALRNLQFFPVEVNKADFRTLLRVPGIGVKSAEKLLSARRLGAVNFEDLHKIGVILKRARFFITCRGKALEKLENEVRIRNRLLFDEARENEKGRQLSLNFETEI